MQHIPSTHGGDVYSRLYRQYVDDLRQSHREKTGKELNGQDLKNVRRRLEYMMAKDEESPPNPDARKKKSNTKLPHKAKGKGSSGQNPGPQPNGGKGTQTKAWST